MSDELAEARKALRCLYIAVEADVARDVGLKVEAAFTALRPFWQPASTLPTAKGTHVLVNDSRFGVGEAMLFDNGKWGLASFNGQIIEAAPIEWMPLPVTATAPSDQTAGPASK